MKLKSFCKMLSVTFPKGMLAIKWGKISSIEFGIRSFLILGDAFGVFEFKPSTGFSIYLFGFYVEFIIMYDKDFTKFEMEIQSA